MYQLAVIGAGQLGSRHLQGLAKANLEAEIWVVDLSQESLNIAESRYNEVKSDKMKVHFITDFNKVSSPKIDFAIIATGSKYRLQALKSLTDQCSVKYLLLEKILFPSIEEYALASQILKEKNIKAWVNCTMRMNDFFRSIKDEINGSKFTLSINAKSAGLACNGIHYFDFFAYLADNTNIKLSAELSSQYESKRPGYIEFDGALNGIDEKGNMVNITSINNGTLEINYLIQTADKQIMIDEMNGEFWVKSAATNNVWKQDKFRVQYQSELSGIIAETVISNGTCKLTPYEEAEKIHLLFLNPFLEYMQQTSKEKITVCPIT
jgi:predicted dehydrogenase